MKTGELTTTYVHLSDGGAARTLDVTDTFWDELTSGARPELEKGRLVTCFVFAADWDAWERHPLGDEVVCLLSGSVDFVLEGPGGDETIALRTPGSFAVVPRGTWHTAKVHSPSSMLFITAGEGTEHRPCER